MSDETNPLEDAVEQALDAFVYAPIGLVFDGPALFPKLVESGRTQVKVARMMGQMAVQMGQGEAAKRVAKAQDHVRGSLTALGLVPPAATERASSATAANKAATTAKKPAPKKSAPKKSSAGTTAPKKPPTPSADGLAIPDYDSLSASQVVKRLDGLATAELDAVKAYESATRARKTILNRVTQLQKD